MASVWLPQNFIRARLNAASTEITMVITTTQTVILVEFQKNVWKFGARMSSM